MYNKKIVFGSGEAGFIDFETKTKIIDYLYSKLDLSKFRYIMLNNIQKLKFLQENQHFVSPNFKGFNYLLMMITLNEKQYCVAIDRKKLSYHKSQLDLKTIQILQLNIKSSDSIYSGTIFDGKLIQTVNEYVFLIQDCFYLMDKKMIDVDMIQKFSHLDSIFKSHFKKPYCTNFEFKLNKLCSYTDLEKLISSLNTLSLNTNGIMFFPKISGINVLHIEKKVEKVEINSTVSEIIEQKSYHIIHDFVNFLKSRSYSYESNGKNKILYLSKTIIPDVYDISEKESSDKLGIALIPNLKISQMCDNIINDIPVKFNCIYSYKFKKWIPLNPV